MDKLRAEIDAVERLALRRVDLGVRAAVIAAAIMVLLLATSLPWVGGASGWEVLRGSTDPADQVGLLPRLFAAAALGLGVGLSALALLTRRWAWSGPARWAAPIACSTGYGRSGPGRPPPAPVPASG